MSLSRRARSLGAYLWHGPPGLPSALRLEFRFVVIRWLGILFIAPGLLLAPLSHQQLLGAFGVLIAAAIYNATVQELLRRHPRIIANGYVTMVGDSLLNVAMITVGGGFNSPFYYILYTVTISAAMRYGYGPAMGMAMTFGAFDLLEGYVTGQPPGASFVFRTGFLTITAILAGYLREQAKRAEAALQHRLLAANRLNEATAMLVASLELEHVLQAIASAARYIFDSPCAALVPSSTLRDYLRETRFVSVVSGYPDPALADNLVAAGQALAERDPRDAPPVDPERSDLPVVLPGRRAVAIELTYHGRADSLALLLVTAPTDDARLQLDPDIRNSFLERITLAIENASLYRTLAQRSGDLQRAYADLAGAHEELLRVDEMKTDFLASVSHEIRTPLSSIRSFSELLLTYDEEPEAQREFLTIINNESERLTRLLNDVLDIAKIESGRMEWNMELVDLGDLLCESARTYITPIEQRGLAFVRRIDPAMPEVFGDRDRLQQVIGNLLNNALKFTSEGSITLEARMDGEEVVVAISDTGIGIAPRDQERIFDKFKQVGAVLTDKPKGTGLGLAICREIVERHGGRIWVESELGDGSTFTFTLKAAKPRPSDLALAAVGVER